MLTLLRRRKEKNCFRNPAVNPSSVIPGLQIVTAGKSTWKFENIPLENIPLENIPLENIPLENIPLENIKPERH